LVAIFVTLKDFETKTSATEVKFGVIVVIAFSQKMVLAFLNFRPDYTTQLPVIYRADTLSLISSPLLRH